MSLRNLRKPACIVGLVLGLALVATPAAFASDALAICAPGQPFVYPAGGSAIPFNPDQGGLGPLTNAQAVAAVTQAFLAWENVGTSTAAYSNNGLLPNDIDVTNYEPILNPAGPNGLSEIVFDETGEIFAELFGAGSGILGFAGPDFGDTVTCELLEGSAFLNGPTFTDAIVAEDIMVHEFGHYSNLGHVELNGQLVAFGEGGDDTGPTPDNSTFGVPATFLGTEIIETMYPFYFGSGVGTRTLHADDVASLSNLYPDTTLGTSRATVTGTVFASDGSTRLSGVNVIARNLADPFVDSVSTFSGAFTNNTDQGDPNVGIFTLSNLTPGAEYAIFVDTVTAQAGRFSNPILSPLPGAEEFYSGLNESDNISSADPPLDFVAVVTAAGDTTSGVDVILNGFGPGDPLPVGDDGNVQITLPFTFELCEQEFDSVYINANGNLTFGEGDTDFTESANDFLNGPPRIAALWDDLSPFNLITGAPQGTVTYSESGNSFSVLYSDVPEFLNTGSNTFEITLKRSSNHIDIQYGEITAADGLVGVSCGLAVTSGTEVETDLSALGGRINLHNQPAVYEWFSGFDNDLSDDLLRFNGTSDFNDGWAEPNNSPKQAKSITLPFNSSDLKDYTEIDPAGADIDFYEFDGSAGQTLVAEVTRGQIDSVMGLFYLVGKGNNTQAFLVDANDDASGLLSALQTELPLDGRYAIAVTFCCDYDFDGVDPGQGAPLDGGRYVLDAFLVDGTPVNLGDDDSEEVSIGFSFPFQGASYTEVFINSNGNLTFGSGDTDFSESVSEFLAESPRIAPLWDDLSPNQGGLVLTNGDATSFTVEFIDVPEFFASTGNNFAVTLYDTGEIDIAYGSVAASDGLVGVTEGGGAADPGATDLSAGGGFSATGTTYELFNFASSFDLAAAVLFFAP